MSVRWFALLVFIFYFKVSSCVHNGWPVGDIDEFGDVSVFRPYSKNYPYMIEVLYNDTHICGGVLIKFDVVLTAAECFSNMKNKRDVNEYKLLAGNQIKEDFSGPYVQWRNVKKVVQHNINSYLKYDIALVKSEKPFDETSYVKLIALPEGFESNSYNGENVVQLGWGTTEHGVDSNVLLLIEGFIPIWRECLNSTYDYWKPHERRVLCIQGNKKGTLCYNDDGGPTVILNEDDPTKDILVGITLTGYSEPGWNCDNTKPSLVANVAMYLDWINKIMTTRFN